MYRSSQKKIVIISPHEDIGDYTNRNILYSKYSSHKILTTLYVSNFNYKTKQQKKLKYFLFEKQTLNNLNLYRIYSPKFINNGLQRFISYFVFSINVIFVYYFVDKKKYDYVIGESVPPLCGLAAFFCAFKNKSKFIYQIRDPWPISLVYSGLLNKKSLIYIFFEKINKFIIKKSYFIISVLPYLDNFLIKHYNYKKKIYYLRNGGELDKIKKTKYPTSKVLNVIFCGGFTPAFKIIKVFEAIKKLKKNFEQKFYFTFIGEGVDLNKCKNYVSRNKLNNVMFLKSIKKNKLPAIIAKNHLCLAIVSSNKNQNFGYNLNKVIDYSICGRPILFTINSSKNRFVEQNKMGINCGANPHQIYLSLLKFYRMSQKEKLLMAKNSRLFAKKNLNIKSLAKKYSALFCNN